MKRQFYREQMFSECVQSVAMCCIYHYISEVYLFLCICTVLKIIQMDDKRLDGLTLKERMQPMKSRTAKTRHMLLVDMMSSL